MTLLPDPLLSVALAQAPRAPEDPEQQDPRALGPSSERPTAPPLHCVSSQKAGTYHGRCPGLCRGGQARARGHSGDQAGLGSRRWLGGAGGPWGQRGGLGLAVGGTHSWSGLLKGVDGRDCGRDQGKRWGQGCGQRPGCPPAPPHPRPGLTARAQPSLLVLGGLHCVLGSHLGCTQVPGHLVIEGRGW